MTDEPLPALEPCPWCHGADLSIPVRKRTSVTCENCGAEGPVADKPTLAIAAWNHRSAVREATIEECAKAAENCDTHAWHPLKMQLGIAKAIRALRGPGEKP